ncbi:hypothetical protein L6V77_33740 [Myxococcota bacterium]|nr:hypothetical protein [Myxococcota bacterium]
MPDAIVLGADDRRHLSCAAAPRPVTRLAVGDGETDLSEAADAGRANAVALRRALGQSPGLVELPAGRFPLAEPIRLGAGQRLRGVSAHPGGTVILVEGSAGVFLTGDGAALADLALDVTFPPATGISVQGARVTVERVRVEGAARGVVVEGRQTNIELCAFVNCGVALHCTGRAAATRATMSQFSNGFIMPVAGWAILDDGTNLAVLACEFHASAGPVTAGPAIVSRGRGLSCRHAHFNAAFPHVSFLAPVDDARTDPGARSGGGGHLLEHNLHESPTNLRTRDPVTAEAGAAVVARAPDCRLGESSWNLLLNGSFEHWEDRDDLDGEFPVGWKTSHTPRAWPGLAASPAEADLHGVRIGTDTALQAGLQDQPGSAFLATTTMGDDCRLADHDPVDSTDVFVQTPVVRHGFRALRLTIPATRDARVFRLEGRCLDVGGRAGGTDAAVTLSFWIRAMPPVGLALALFGIQAGLRVDGQEHFGTTYQAGDDLAGLWQRICVRAPAMDLQNAAPFIDIVCQLPAGAVAPDPMPAAEIIVDGGRLDPGLLISEPGEAPVAGAGGVVLGPVELVNGVPLVQRVELDVNRPVVRIVPPARGELVGVVVGAGQPGRIEVERLPIGATDAGRTLVIDAARATEAAGRPVEPPQAWPAVPGALIEVRLGLPGAARTVELRYRKRVFQ